MYDAIVIGSGIGGLTTAGLLARVAGKRVLVLERHTEPGGLTHTFRRDGASWDVGVHYIGQVGPGDRTRAYFDYLSGGQLEWNRMPEAYDRFVYPGIDLSAVSDPEQYERALIRAFPDEAAAVSRYFKDVRRTAAWTTLGFVGAMVPPRLAPALNLLQRLTGRTATSTTKDYLDARFRSPELKAILTGQWGDYGLPPSRSAFAVHAISSPITSTAPGSPAAEAPASHAHSRRGSSRREEPSESHTRSLRSSPRAEPPSGCGRWTAEDRRRTNGSTAPPSSSPPSARRRPFNIYCPLTAPSDAPRPGRETPSDGWARGARPPLCT